MYRRGQRSHHPSHRVVVSSNPFKRFRCILAFPSPLRMTHGRLLFGRARRTNKMWGNLGEGTYGRDAARLRNNSQPDLGFRLPIYTVGYLTDCPVGCSLSTNSAPSSPHQLDRLQVYMPRWPAWVSVSVASAGRSTSYSAESGYRGQMIPSNCEHSPDSDLDAGCALTAVPPSRQG